MLINLASTFRFHPKRRIKRKSKSKSNRHIPLSLRLLPHLPRYPERLPIPLSVKSPQTITLSTRIRQLTALCITTPRNQMAMIDSLWAPYAGSFVQSAHIRIAGRLVDDHIAKVEYNGLITRYCTVMRCDADFAGSVESSHHRLGAKRNRLSNLTRAKSTENGIESPSQPDHRRALQLQQSLCCPFIA